MGRGSDPLRRGRYEHLESLGHSSDGVVHCRLSGEAVQAASLRGIADEFGDQIAVALGGHNKQDVREIFFGDYFLIQLLNTDIALVFEVCQ